MPEEIDVACPGCNAIFGVPQEYCGETAECAECGTMFEIPGLPEEAGNLEDTKTGAIQGIESDDAGEATNTVRLSRTSIGMIPQVKDSFSLGSSASPTPKKPMPSAAAPRPAAPRPAAPARPNAPTPASAPAPTPASAPAAQQAPAGDSKKIIIPSWATVRMKKGEDVLGVRESISSPVGTAVLIAISALVAGGAGIAAKFVDVPIAAGIVFFVAIIVFVVAMLMAKSGSKKALIVTSQRSISVMGKDRMEVKR